MRINNKSITGLFLYSPDATYERNDMVIVGSTIYVCNPSGSDSIQGSNPKNDSENFYTYLADQTASVSECLNFMESGEGENRIIDVTTLQAVLNHFMMGINSKGVIGDCIEVTKAGKYRIIINGVDESSNSNINYNNILSYIIQREDINNAIFRVSNNLPEVQIYGVGEYCILKQYTTKKNGYRIRIQELIDPQSGLIYLRSIKGNETPGAFKCSVIKGYHIKEQIDKILEVYTSRLEYLQVVEDSLKDNFRYRQLSRDESNASSVKIDLEDRNGTYYTGPTDLITVLLKKKDSKLNEDLVYRTESTSISLKESQDCSYKIFGGENKLIITLSANKDSLTIRTDDPENITISEITYREYYGA